MYTISHIIAYPEIVDVLEFVPIQTKIDSKYVLKTNFLFFFWK